MANWLDDITPGGSSWTGPANMAPSTTRGGYRPTPMAAPAPFRDILKEQADYARNRRTGAGFVNRMTGGAPQAPQTPSFEDFVAMFGGGGGGGYTAPDMSGYNEMLGDIVGREKGYARRKKEQEGYIKGIIEAARLRSEAEKGNVAGRYQTLLDQAATRRAQETAALQSGEAARIDTRNAARAALGATGGEDLTSAATEGAVANVGAAGDVSTRDANIQQSIENQQLANQISGLDPMRAQAFMTLRSNYEDRLAQLAAERAGIKNQIAQIQATPRSTGGGSSTSENLALWQAYNEMIGGGEPVDLGDTSLSILQTYSNANPGNTALYRDVVTNLPTLMQNYGMSTTGKLMDPIEVANAIVKGNSSLGPAYNFIVDLVKNYQG